MIGYLKRGGLALGLAVALAAGTVAAQSAATRTERVQFARGHSSSTVTGSLRGYDTVDYRIGVREGQAVHVAMRGSNRAGYFNVRADGDEESLFMGDVEGDTFDGTWSQTGDVIVRVYLMRSAARRGETLNYSLVIAVH